MEAVLRIVALERERLPQLFLYPDDHLQDNGRAGFVVTGEVPDLYRIDGESQGSVMMSRRLS